MSASTRAIKTKGCMGLAVPGKAGEHCEDNTHPRYDESECEEEELKKKEGQAEADKLRFAKDYNISKVHKEAFIS